MPTYQVIDDPEHIVFFDRWSKRMIGFSVAAYLIGLVIWLAAPSGYRARITLMLVVLVVYMTLWLLVSVPFAVRRFRKRSGLAPRTLPVLPYPLSLRYTMAQSGGGLLPMAIVMSLQSPGPLGITFLISMPLLGIGASLMLAWRLREPSPLSCPKCAYPVDPPVFPAMCTECAAPMSTINAATRMPQIKRPHFLGLGVALIAASFFLFYTMLFKPAALVGALPRPARLAMAATDEDVFATIDTAKLTADQRDQLTDRILDVRGAGTRQYGMDDQIDWIGERLLANDLDAKRAERYLLGDNDGILQIIQRAAGTDTDSATQISIRAQLPTLGFDVVAHAYFFSGFEIESRADPGARESIARSEDLLRWRPLTDSFEKRDQALRDYPTLAGRLRVPTIELPAEAPLRLRARVIFVAIDANAAPQLTITWHDDGTYTITPEPLAAFERSAEALIEPNP
jgi:hypothetical protein